VHCCACPRVHARWQRLEDPDGRSVRPSDFRARPADRSAPALGQVQLDGCLAEYVAALAADPDAVVVLLTDHGGKPYDRTALKLLLPAWLLARHPAAAASLERNTKQWTTHYDVRATLRQAPAAGDSAIVDCWARADVDSVSGRAALTPPPRGQAAHRLPVRPHRAAGRLRRRIPRGAGGGPERPHAARHAEPARADHWLAGLRGPARRLRHLPVRRTPAPRGPPGARSQCSRSGQTAGGRALGLPCGA
jgi:hypothetical protein